MNAKTVSFFDIVAAMRARSPLICPQVSKLPVKARVLIQSIEAESGSGRTWNIRVQYDLASIVIFWDESKPCPFSTF